MWSALSVLAAATKRQVWLDRGTYALYPNLFVILVAESAKIRKSAAINIAVKLLETAVPDIQTLSDSATPEGIVKHINRTIKVDNPNDIAHPTIRRESHIFIHADELATLFTYDKQRASRLSILLTQMYNCQEQYKHTLKSEAQLVIFNCFPTLLAATDPFNLKVLPEETVGGFLGRSIFVTSRERRKNVAWPEFKGGNLKDQLTVDLARISALKGEISITKEARNRFAEWYDKLSEEVITDRRLDAFHQREHDTALKIATLLSVSENNELLIEERHLNAAITIVGKQRVDFVRVQDWNASTNFAGNRQKFLDILRRNGGQATRKLVIRTLGISTEEFASLETTLIESDAIKKLGTSPIMYKMTAEEILRQQGGG